MFWIVFAPAFVAILLALFPKDTDDNVFRYITLGATLGVLAAVVGVFFFPSSSLYFDSSVAAMQHVE